MESNSISLFTSSARLRNLQSLCLVIPNVDELGRASDNQLLAEADIHTGDCSLMELAVNVFKSLLVGVGAIQSDVVDLHQLVHTSDQVEAVFTLAQHHRSYFIRGCHSFFTVFLADLLLHQSKLVVFALLRFECPDVAFVSSDDDTALEGAKTHDAAAVRRVLDVGLEFTRVVADNDISLLSGYDKVASVLRPGMARVFS